MRRRAYLRSLALVASMTLAAACQGGEEGASPRTVEKASARSGPGAEASGKGGFPRPRSEEELMGLPLEALERRAARYAESLPAEPTTPETLAAFLDAAATRRILALRAGQEEPLEGARDLLTRASRAEVDPALACEAYAALVDLLGRDLHRFERAAALAEAGRRRFRGETGAAECAERMRSVARLLSPLRPDDPAEPISPPWVEADTPELRRLVVYGAERQEPSAGVRAVVELSNEVDPDSTERPPEGERPRRIWLDFDRLDVRAEVPEAIEVGAGGLRRVTRSALANGGQRLSFELESEAIVRRFRMRAPPRIVFDVRLGGGEPPPGRDGPRDLRRVVLDPGHGGDEWGANNGGIRESHLVLDIARRAAHAITERLPGVEVLLTRLEDVSVPLDRRTAMANAAGADLFISIHLNDSEVDIQRGGVTTFVLDTTDDEQALRLAARENGTTEAQVTGMQRLIAGLHRDGQVDESRRLAAHVHRAVLSSGRAFLPDLADRGVRSSLFYVLVGARMPAVLVEASFISEPDELRALQTSAYRQALAEGIARGVVVYAHGE